MKQLRVIALIFGAVAGACSDHDTPPDEGTLTGAGQGHAGEPNGAGAGNEAGAASALECPLDFGAAEGADCSAFGEGAVCTGGTKCGGGDSLVCVEGVWVRQQALVIPC